MIPIKIESGILDKTRLTANILMLILVAGNIFFSIQYTESIKREQAAAAMTTGTTEQRVETAHFLKFFIDVVLNTKGTISYDDRVKLESDVHQLGDADITRQWDVFVASKDAATAQAEAVRLMSMLTSKLL